MKKIIILLAILSCAISLQAQDCDSIVQAPSSPSTALPEYLSLLNLIIKQNNVDYSELVVVILKDTTILDTLNFSTLIEQRKKEQDVRNAFFGRIDTVKKEKENYYYQTSIFGKRSIVKAEKYDSRNLLIESTYFGDDSLVSEKTFFKYNEKKMILSEKKYNFWVKAPDSILASEIYHMYKKGKLTKQTAVIKILHTPARRESNIYYNELGKAIRAERFVLKEDDSIIWKSINEYEYNKENNIIGHKFCDLDTQKEVSFEYFENRIIIYKLGKDGLKEKDYEYILK
jgi:hypothetical protein